MKNYTLNSVVVPWDFSPMSKSALEAALEMVEDPSKIEVIHVTPYPAATEYGLYLETLNLKGVSAEVTQSFETAMKEAGFPELSFTTMFGDPGAMIADFAKAKKAGLVVISSHGRTGLTRLFMGSVAERVVRLSPCPVLVLRGDQEETE